MASLSYEKVISSYVPLPICVINKQGKVLSASNRINEVFIYDRIVDSDIFTLTGIKATDLYEIAISHEYPLIRRNEKIFKLIPQRIGSEEEALLSVLFSDVTTFDITMRECALLRFKLIIMMSLWPIWQPKKGNPLLIP